MKPSRPFQSSRWLRTCRVILSSLILHTSSFAVESPLVIPFQGLITTQPTASAPGGAPVASGQYSIIFNLYAEAVGGQPIWTERHTKVGVSDGMVNLFLGSITSMAQVDFSQTRYLGITIDVDDKPTTPDPEMVPRQMIIPAFHAKNSEKMAGYDWSAILVAGVNGNNPSAGKIRGDKLADISVTGNQVANNTIDSLKIKDGTINSVDFAPGAVDSAIGNGSITSARILDGTIAPADLADSSVTSAKIQDGTVVGTDIATDSIPMGGIAYRYASFWEQQTGNIGGGVTTANSWTRRTLNTEDNASGGSISRSGNTVTLQPGKYLVRARCPCGLQVSSHQAVIRDVTGGGASVALRGTTMHNSYFVPGGAEIAIITHSEIEGHITVATSSRQFEIWHYTVGGNSNPQAFGLHNNQNGNGSNTEPSVYSQIMIWKVK